VKVLGGILGALVGFAIGILFVEVIFANNQSWPDVVPFALAVAGALAGSAAAARIRVARRQTSRSPHST
jgi:ABC-type antimicrobial peptide transport system permease subunit